MSLAPEKGWRFHIAFAVSFREAHDGVFLLLKNIGTSGNHSQFEMVKRNLDRIFSLHNKGG